MAKKRSNGEGNLWHDKERGRWEARFTVGFRPDGTPIRRKVTGRTQTEARDRMREAMHADQSGERRARADFSVRAFLEEWSTDVLPGSVAPSTEQQYKDVIRLYVVPHLGRKKLATLTARDVAAMLRALSTEGRSPNTCRLARSVLRRALRWAEAEGLVARNAAAIAFGVRVPSPDGRTMTLDEARQFLAAIEGHRFEAAWTTMLTLGLRRGELLGLAWGDIRLDASPPALTIVRALKRLPELGLHVDDVKTKTSRRTVHLPAPTVAALRAHKARQAAERLAAGAEWVPKPLGLDLVFRTPFGTPLDPDNFRQATYAVTERSGLGRWSPHELRHVAASLLIALGVPLKTISETLGHSSIRVTADVYGHLLDESRSEAAAAIDRAFG